VQKQLREGEITKRPRNCFFSRFISKSEIPSLNHFINDNNIHPNKIKKYEKNDKKSYAFSKSKKKV